MRSITVSLAASLLFYVSLVQSTSHHLFVGSFESNQIFALAYDNETNALTMEKPMTAHQASPVLAFNNNRTVLYAGEQDGWSSYKVQSPTALSFTKHIPIRGRCFGDVLKHGQTNLLVSKKPPFNVHGVGPSPCGVVMSVRADGSLDCVIQKTPYQNTSLVQSMAMDKEGKWMFSADQHANGIWTHRVDPNTGKLDRRSFTPMPLKYARPKKLVLHPAGNYLYVLLAEQSSVASFEIVYGQAGRPKLRCTSNVYSLLPNGINPKQYRGQELVLSADSNILYGTVRYSSAKDIDADDSDDNDTKRIQANANIHIISRDSVDPVHVDNPNLSTRQIANPGYLTAILLSDPPGPPPPRPGTTLQPKGYPLQMFMQAATTTAGGASNAVAPAPWHNGFFALTDSEVGIVQIWRLDGLADLPRDAVRPPKNKGRKAGQAAQAAQTGTEGMASLLPPALANIRANIVAEWRAPAHAVGDAKPAQANPRGDDRRPSRAGAAALGKRNHPPKGRPGSGMGRPQGTRSGGGATGLIPGGKGCCADAVWYD